MYVSWMFDVSIHESVMFHVRNMLESSFLAWIHLSLNMKIAFMHEIYWNVHETHMEVAFMDEMYWNVRVSGAPF